MIFDLMLKSEILTIQKINEISIFNRLVWNLISIKIEILENICKYDDI